MTETSPEYLDVGEGATARRIALLRRDGRGPCVVWLGGFRSDMRATKASELDAWAAREGRAFLRFDYTAHGESPGDFEACTVTMWLEDTLAAIEAYAGPSPVLVGSSMGGWMALLATAHLARHRPSAAPGGLVLIAPAVDFTERMQATMPDEGRAALAEHGVWYRPSAYSDEPYPITRRLLDSGRRHLLLERPIDTGCPVHILQGMQDPDVPWQHAMEVVEHLPGDSVSLTLIKDGDHRLSRPEDLERLVASVAAMCARQTV